MIQSRNGDEAAIQPDGPRILIMEDEFIVAMDLCDMAAELGLAVVGPFATLVEGLEAIRQLQPDAAILDVHLADGEVFPLADELTRLGVPLIFHSGHADSRALLARYPGARSAAKPCAPELLTAYLRQVTERVPPSGPDMAKAV